MGLVYGIGVYEKGKYVASVNMKKTTEYRIWQNMLGRCYNPKIHQNQPTYVSCSVSKEWLNFQTFAEWFNKYSYYFSGYQLDKDLIMKGNKVYSPESCIFIPMQINNLITKADKVRGNYPLGVHKVIKLQKYCASFSNRAKGQYIGLYSTTEEAFEAYKVAKENYIKSVAEEYKGRIDPKAYKALMEYEVDIND